MIIHDCVVVAIKSALHSAKEQEQQIVTLQTVSGYTVEELTRLFAAGYTLAPPKPPETLSDILGGQK